MAMFRYEVMDRTGKVLSGAMAAPDEVQVRQKLTSMGYTVRLIVGPPVDVSTRAQPARKAAPAPAQVATGPTQRTTAPPSELVVFFRQIQSLLQSGFGMFDALIRIQDQTGHRGMRHIVESMARRVQMGGQLSAGMAEFPRVFPPHVVGVVAAGELGGFLPIVLADIALDYEIEQRASVRWMKWLTSLIWWNVAGMILLLPALPLLPTIAKSGVSGYLHEYLSVTLKYFLPPVAFVIIAYLGTRSILRRPQSRAAVHAMLLKLPVYGRASRERSLANFSRMLWRLQTAGILPIQAWDVASLASNNVMVAARLREQVTALKSGAKFSDAMSASRLFRDEDRRILEVGELSGQTADILQRMAMFYEDAALSSAGRTRAMGLRFALIVYALTLVALFASEGMYLMNLMNVFDETSLEPLLWLLSPTK